MLVILMRAQYRYTFDWLPAWAPEVGGRMRLVPYSELHELDELVCRTLVFSDLERLTPPELEEACSLAARLEETVPRLRVLNDPRRTLRRYDLLRRLHEAGVNDFRAFRLSDVPDDLRLPAFLRIEDDHEGPRSEPLKTRAELDREIARLSTARRNLSRILAVEFVDVSDADGVFHKYAAWVIEDEIVPRQRICSRRWWIKLSDVWDEEKFAAERAYLERNPHEDELRAAAELVGAKFGRFDYAVKDGRLQIWEFNTNPNLGASLEEIQPERLSSERVLRDRLATAFDRLATSGDEVRVQLGVPAGVFIEPWDPRAQRRHARDRS